MMSKEEKEQLERTIRAIHDEVFKEGYEKGYRAGYSDGNKAAASNLESDTEI